MWLHIWAVHRWVEDSVGMTGWYWGWGVDRGSTVIRDAWVSHR